MPKLDIGGIERVLIIYANELVDRGYDVDFVLCVSGGTLQPLLNTKIKLIDLGGIKLRKALFPLRKYLKESQPNFLYTGSNLQNIVAVLAGYGLNTKIIISQHNYFDVDVKRLGKWSIIEQQAMRLIYPYADIIIAVSQGIKKYLEQSIKIKPDKILYLPNPIDINHIKQQAKVALTYKLPEKYIVFIGRLSPVKNIKLLLDSFNKVAIENLHLIIVGDGIDAENMKRYSATLPQNNKIIFVGSQSNPLPYLVHAKCLVLCSFSEAMPAILLEAMTLNIPIVATPTKGAIELISQTKGNYISKSFNDIDELTKLIETAYKNEQINMEDYILPYDKKNIVNIFESQLFSL